ncbi:MAG: prepilin-type N-terminal cleavage/methylation domain-containing protein [Gemmatimonadaceae bacterium]
MQTTSPHSRDRRAFALVEVIVALALLTVAVFALAATGGRLIGVGVAATRRTLATARMQSVADSLRSVPCRSLGSGTDSTLGVRVTWSVTAGAASRSVLVSAAFADRTVHTLLAETLIPCD